MILDWSAYTKEMSEGSKEISDSNPDIIKAYAAFHHANSNSKHLDAKTRELIALGVAVSLRCDGCINAHTDAAIKAGATKDEIVDALGVAIMVNAGAALVYSVRTLDAFDSKVR